MSLKTKPTGNSLWHMYLNKSKDKPPALVVRFTFVAIFLKLIDKRG